MNSLGTLAVADLMEKLCGQDNETYREWTGHGPGDACWDKADYLDRLATLDIPVFLQGGWFDTATSGAMLAYQKLRGAGNRQLKLIVGPWAHSAKSSTTLAGMDFGEAAGIDLYRASRCSSSVRTAGSRGTPIPCPARVWLSCCWRPTRARTPRGEMAHCFAVRRDRDARTIPTSTTARD